MWAIASFARRGAKPLLSTPYLVKALLSWANRATAHAVPIIYQIIKFPEVKVIHQIVDRVAHTAIEKSGKFIQEQAKEYFQEHPPRSAVGSVLRNVVGLALMFIGLSTASYFFVVAYTGKQGNQEMIWACIFGSIIPAVIGTLTLVNGMTASPLEKYLEQAAALRKKLCREGKSEEVIERALSDLARRYV